MTWRCTSVHRPVLPFAFTCTTGKSRSRTRSPAPKSSRSTSAPQRGHRYRARRDSGGTADAPHDSLVYRDAAHLPDDAGEFAVRFSVAQFLTSPTRPLTARLTAKAMSRMTELMSDAFEPREASPSLLALRCAVVDPELTKELPVNGSTGTIYSVSHRRTSPRLPATLSASRTRCAAGEDCIVVWIPGSQSPAQQTWRSFRPTRDMPAAARPLRRSLHPSQRLPAFMSFSPLLNMSRIRDAKGRARRKAASLDVLRIAARFVRLTTRHQWRQQINEWSSMIESDALPLL